jgi:multiple sugar transport system substrate-binding protein
VFALSCATLLLMACGGQAPQAPQVVVQTQVVAGPTQVVVQTSAPVVVTATPEPVADDTDPNSPITVWIDSTRQPAIERYIATHPDAKDKVKFELVDRGQFPAKVLLFNNTGSGWPDVVFAEPNLVAAVADASRDFPLDLTDLVPQDIRKGFSPGALEPCILDGKLVCMRNDLAQNVMWYNKPLMEKFGYEVPTTWEDYELLGEKVAKEHPGYVIGSFGDDIAFYVYLWASRCPLTQLVTATQVYINTADPKCERAVKMVDKLLANGSISKLSFFDPGFAKLANENKVLLLPAASWFGEYIFGGKPDSLYYKTAEGQLGVALPPKWRDEEKAWTGAIGGSAWTVSKHTKNPKLAVDLVVWLTTSNDYQGTAPTYPAYMPAAQEWAKTLRGNKLYAFDPFPVLQEAASLIDPLWGSVRYDAQATSKSVLVGALSKGETLASAMPEFQKQLTELAQAQGYEVLNSR